jgi:hypothetical protein
MIDRSTSAIVGVQEVSAARPRPGTGLSAVRRGLANMKIHGYLTAAAVWPNPHSWWFPCSIADSLRND